MFEYDWKTNKTVYRNLLGIRGISDTTAKKLCALIGISHDTRYGDLSLHKLDQLNLVLNTYNKKTKPFSIHSLADFKEGVNLGPNLNNETAESSSASFSRGHNAFTMLHNPIMYSLDTFKKENILNFVQMNAYKGRRFKFGYPVRGQRTRSNAQTARRLNRVGRHSAISK